VIGKQWMWKVQHPGGQREINELHIPVGRPVKLTLISEDVIHDFGVPAFRMKVDVLPNRYVGVWYQPTRTGRFRLFCNQYCGTGHAQMIGVVTVMPPEEYESWLREKAEGSPALEGRKLFLKLQCVTCHSADSEARAPVLEGLYGRNVPLRGGGTAVADRDYIRDSILDPRKQIVSGWEPIMPTFREQVTEDDLLQLIAYIRSLGPSETPDRNEDASAPVGTPNSGTTREADRR
jgi:cytochrome c oxidase subunit II